MGLWEDTLAGIEANRDAIAREARRVDVHASNFGTVYHRLDQLAQRIEVLEQAPPPPTPEEPAPEEPVPTPEPEPEEPSPGMYLVHPRAPARPQTTLRRVVVGDETFIQAVSGTHYEIPEGSFLRTLQIPAGVNDIRVTGPGRLGSVANLPIPGTPRRIHFEGLRMTQIYTHLSDLTVERCIVDNTSGGAGGDGYALWCSQYGERMCSKMEFIDCTFHSHYSGAANGCIRLTDVEDVHFRNCTMDSGNHRGFRLHGFAKNVLVDNCQISMGVDSSTSPLGGAYIAPHLDQRWGFLEYAQFINCSIRDTFEVGHRDDQVDRNSVWLTATKLYALKHALERISTMSTYELLP